MEYKELAKLDKEINEAHERLVSLNNEYNDLLTNIYNSKNNRQTPEVFVSERERKLNKIQRRIRFIYWIIFVGNLLVDAFLKIPSGIYSSILFADIIFYFVGSVTCGVKIAKEKVKNEGTSTNKDNKNAYKDELYEKLCQAREVYHSLRNKRDEVVIEDLDNVDELTKEENKEATVDDEQVEVKTLSLNNN